MWKITPDSKLVELPAPDGARAARGVVWIPTETLVFERPKLPPGRKKLWRQTVPYALEDAFIESIEMLHFALGEMHDDGVPVAAVARKRMDEWLALLADAGVDARVILPDVCALPLEPERRTIWYENGRCLYRADEHSGMAGSLEWIASLASLHGRADRFDVYCNSTDTEALPGAWRERARPLPGPLDEVMTHADTGAAINLLQGDYAPGSTAATWVRPWRWAAALALVLFGAHLGALTIETRWLDARAGEFVQNTGRLFESLAIDSELIDLRAQVERRLKQLEEHRAKSDSNVWDLVARMEQPLSNCKSCRVDLLDFKQQEILLEVSIAGDPQQLKRLFEKLPGAQATHNDLPDKEDRKRVRFQVKPL